MERYNKVLKVTLIVVVIMSILFSVIYADENANHTCHRQGCPICLQLHAAQDLIKTIKASAILIVETIILLTVVIHKLYRISVLRRQRTLVTLKVQLRN